MTETQATKQQHEESEAAPVSANETPAAAEAAAMTTSGRARRTIQKFGFDESVEHEEDEFKPPVGPGVKVRDMEAISEKISHYGKKDAETIKSLYNIMYSRRFQQKNVRTIKDHILDFSGIPDADEKTRQQLAGKMGRWMRSYVQGIMDVLGVDRSKKSFDEENKPFDKDSLINRLIDWLCNPQEPKNAKRAATKKKATTPKAAASKKTASTAKVAAGTKRKSPATTKKPAKKAKTSAKKSAPVEEADEEDVTESEVEKEAEGEDSDSDFDEDNGAKSKKKKTAKRAPKNAGPRRGKKSTAVIESDDEEAGNGHDDEDGDDAMDASDEKPAGKSNGLGEDVRNKVKDIIANGDAEQLTVKKIVRQLSEDLGKDFSAQKSAIKDFVTNLAM